MCQYHCTRWHTCAILDAQECSIRPIYICPVILCWADEMTLQFVHLSLAVRMNASIHMYPMGLMTRCALPVNETTDQHPNLKCKKHSVITFALKTTHQHSNQPLTCNNRLEFHVDNNAKSELIFNKQSNEIQPLEIIFNLSNYPLNILMY